MLASPSDNLQENRKACMYQEKRKMKLIDNDHFSILSPYCGFCFSAVMDPIYKLPFRETLRQRWLSTWI